MMLIVSLLAFVAYAAVFMRAAIFAMQAGPRRQADNCEVGFLMASSFIYVMSFVCLWVFEPAKLTNNSPASTMFVGFTIFTAAYFFRRIGALTVGRERRRDERRAEDISANRRQRRPPV